MSVLLDSLQLGAFAASQAIPSSASELMQWQGAQNLYRQSYSFQEQLMEGYPSPMGHTHLSQVRTMRKAFKEYSKEEFRNLSHDPMVKDILTGAHKLSKEEILDRVKEHLNAIA